MTDQTESESDPSREPTGRTGRTGRPATVRLVLGVAVLFALLGGLLVRIAAGASLDGFLGGALAVLVLTAAVAVFGSGTIRAATSLWRP